MSKAPVPAWWTALQVTGCLLVLAVSPVIIYHFLTSTAEATEVDQGTVTDARLFELEERVTDLERSLTGVVTELQTQRAAINILNELAGLAKSFDEETVERINHIYYMLDGLGKTLADVVAELSMLQ